MGARIDAFHRQFFVAETSKVSLCRASVLRREHLLPDGSSVFVSSRCLSDAGARSGNANRPVGGVVSALAGVLSRVGGTWVAWDGGVRHAKKEQPVLTNGKRYDVRLIRLDPQQIEGWYYGFANQVLWPLLHCFPDKCRFSNEQWQIFESVNRRFAQEIAHGMPANATIWIHDYQLSRVPRLLRECGLEARVGFFHHVPFPPPSVFRVNPWWREIVVGMLGGDFIGFHRQADVDNFVALVQGYLPYDAGFDSPGVLIGDRFVKLAAVPLGIDTNLFEDLCTAPSISREAAAIREACGCEYLMLGVDRLDYTKGLLERLRAVDLLLTTWPQLCGRVSLVQIAVPCRESIPEYSQLKYHVEETVRRINKRYASPSWVPIQLMTEPVPHSHLVAFYEAADIALVTPLRDGLNLVAKEFVASKAGAESVLLLSTFAGVSDDFASDAILVNPHDPLGIAQAIVRAIQMPTNEKKERMQRLLAKVRRRDLGWWITTLNDELRQPEVDTLI